ncbi:MAG: MBL fold metallo-hydrolase [Deltaproteobacteria bacterium]|nr:MBL fold metallo-hydrolase [Deltaproteobacteria bacterium]
MENFNGIKYEWLAQSGLRMTTDDGFVIYTDPIMLDPGPPKAGLILISHHHVDHCLPEFVAAIRDDNTRLAAFHESYVKYCAQDIKRVRTVKIGQTIDLSGVKITGIEAYTKRGFHMRGEGCGFIIELRGQRIYFSGDTAGIKEMEGLGPIDVAILPIADNTYTIDLHDAASAVRLIKPKLFIPVHYTPMDEPDPRMTEGMMFSKDPRFFTRKEDPSTLNKELGKL